MSRGGFAIDFCDRGKYPPIFYFLLLHQQSHLPRGGIKPSSSEREEPLHRPAISRVLGKDSVTTVTPAPPQAPPAIQARRLVALPSIKVLQPTSVKPSGPRARLSPRRDRRLRHFELLCYCFCLLESCSVSAHPPTWCASHCRTLRTLPI